MQTSSSWFLKKIEYISPLVVFSCFFITQLTKLSPLYVGFAVSVLLFYMSFSVNVHIKFLTFSITDYIIVLFIFLLSVYICISGLLNHSNMKDILFMIWGYLFFIFAFPVIYMDFDRFKKNIKYLIIFTLLLFVVEAVYRISHPSALAYAITGKNFFYMFKWNSIIFSDTNETGFLELIFFSFLLYLKNEQSINIKKRTLFLCSILIILTFSRAAILAMFALLFYIYFFRKLNTVKKFTLVVFLFIFVIILFFILVNDASFLTKLDIFSKTIQYISNSNFKNFLFGNGLYNSQYVLGIYGHNYLTLYLVEFGFIGLLLFITIFLLIFIKCHKVYYILITYLIAGLSYAPNFIPYVYFFMGIICMLEKEKYKWLKLQ